MDSGGAVAMAALGRPFSLGMLYDCRKDMLVPGMTLWNEDVLKEHVREKDQPFSNFEILASDSLQDKSNALNVDASLKASFCSGLVDVEGSAKYLKSTKSSKNQASVTVKYEATTKFTELSMEHLGDPKYRYVFEKGLATHVVTAILYGAKAFLEFESEVSKDENQQTIQGKLQVAVKKIPTLSIDGKGEVTLTDDLEKETKSFSCKFHGDFFLDKNPTTFKMAVETYLKLPSYLKNHDSQSNQSNQKAIPVRVWMLPLAELDSSASKLVRQISLELVQEAQKVLEDFGELAIRSNDALKMETVQKFPQIAEKLRYFSEMCSEFKLSVQQSFAEKLPLIRGGGEDETKLAEILKKRHSSPFNSNSLNQWMESKEKEIDTLNQLTKMVNNKSTADNKSTVVTERDLYKSVLSKGKCLCFVFTSLGVEEPFLSALSGYMKGAQPDNQNLGLHEFEKKQWYSSQQLKEVVENVKKFNDFKQNNKEYTYLVVGLTNNEYKGSTIYSYEDGFPVSEHFEFPNKPTTDSSIKDTEATHS